MKITSILIGLSMLLIKSNSLLSQDRINKPVPVIGTEVRGVLEKSEGWLLNPEGQWISRPNRIPSFIENRFKILIDYQHEGLGIDNFISYQIRDIKIQNSTYLILIKKFTSGYYKYSSIKEGWSNYDRVQFYVFDKEEFSKLNDIVNDSINLIKIQILYSNSIRFSGNETYISDIQQEIVRQVDDNKVDKEKENYLIFHIAPYKTKNIVQYQIYSSYSKFNIIDGIIKEHKVRDESGKYSTDKRNIYLSNDLFKYCYYEVDYVTFNKFIQLSN